MKEVVAGMELSLAELPAGMSAEIVSLSDSLRSRKKFADAGMVPGMTLAMQSRAPFGSLLRVKILGSSLALHSCEGKNIRVKAC